MDIEKMSNLLGADLAKKVYEDGASEGIKELGKVATDLIKTLRLFTAPIQLAAAYQDRLAKHLDKVRNNVKAENQIEAPSSIAGPILERLKYLEDDNYLTDLYLNLLTRAIDKERINEAHPAFFNIIEQLSPDEALILFLIKKEKTYYTYDKLISNLSGEYKPDKINSDCPILEKINIAAYFEMYIEHLKSINLIRWKILSDKQQIREGNVIYATTNSEIVLTEFGELFVKACIPKNGFNTTNANDK